eukprot:GEMP01025760.1.p1 GENE.GEMP01025760.1~~GEMP01025760.1.p1  ORF type:complete len:505 (+),score=91.69 GEMP01025760.1:108-1622(+)
MATGPPPSTVIQRLKTERDQWDHRLQRHLEEKIAVGRFDVADKFERHCVNTDTSTLAFNLAWRDTMEDAWTKKSKEQESLEHKVMYFEEELAKARQQTSDAHHEIAQINAKDRLEEVNQAEAEVVILQEYFEKTKEFFMQQLKEKDNELEELRRECVDKNLRCKRLEEENDRLGRLFLTLEEGGGEIKALAKQLQFELLVRKNESRKYDSVCEKYESLACRFQALTAEHVVLKEELSVIDQKCKPLVSLGSLDRLGAPAGTLRQIGDREIEWRVAEYHNVVARASNNTLIISEIFEIEGMPLKFELSPKCGKIDLACFLFVQHVHKAHQPRIAFHLSLGDQMFPSQLPLRPHEAQPWVRLEEVDKQIDRYGVITFSFELIEFCRDQIVETEGQAEWKLGTNRASIYGSQRFSVGLSPLFKIAKFADLQLEFFPCGEDDAATGCVVYVMMPSDVSMRYIIKVSDVGEARGTSWASESDTRQRLPHAFTGNCGDEEVTITLQLVAS